MKDVKVTISMTQPIGSVGFGIPLILEERAETAVPYTECTSLADVEKAMGNDTCKVYKAAQIMLMQDNAPAKFAICSTKDAAETWVASVDNYSKDWRQLIVVAIDDTTIGVSNIMTAIETLEASGVFKMYFADLTTDSTATITTTDIDRTVLFYHGKSTDSVKEFASAALVGATAGLEAGSFTYKNMILSGLTPSKLTDTELSTINGKKGMAFVTKAGDNVTSEGKTAGGEYIDIIDSKDYIISNLEYKTQKLLNTMKKIPYDNKGIAILESVAVDVLKDAYNKGIIATNDDGTPAYTVNYAQRTATSEADRAARKYIGGQFAFTLAGAVHEVKITGEIII